MTYALTIVNLQEAMEKTGCPVCRLGHKAAVQSIDAFLWENVNDPVVRQPINDAYGFCAEHTRMLVAVEMSTSGPVLGVNLIYELLARNVVHDLERDWSQRAATIPLLGRLFKSKNQRVLVPQGRCPICKVMEKSELNTVSDLMEEFERPLGGLLQSYQESDGLCLAHVRQALEKYGTRFPLGCDLLVKDTICRLVEQSEQMKTYIRKQNWEYRDEKATREEMMAWLKTVTFFTGYPGERFTFRIEDF